MAVSGCSFATALMISAPCSRACVFITARVSTCPDAHLPFAPPIRSPLFVRRISVQDALIAPGKPVALYFSAHWCPPCRGFTPQLAKWYGAGLQDKLEVVFVSSDRDQGAFDGYFGEQPWLALPFEDRKAKAALSKKFKVQGIPTLVILDADGALVTTKGRARVSADHGADADPLSWRDPTLADILYGKDGNAELCVKGDGGKGSAKVKAADHLKGKTLGIYFSAHWCPPCRGFTPSLCATYKKLAEAGKTASEFEIIFASSDRDEGAFDEYWAEMPFAALPYADRARKEALSELFGVSGIPTLVFVARRDSAEHFFRSSALHCTATARILIPAECSAVS